MSRVRIVIPILLSSLAGPAFGEALNESNVASTCQPYNWLTASCQVENDGALAAANAAERRRAVVAHEAAISTASRCQPQNWLTAGCRSESERTFAAARNAEIEASLAAVRKHRAELALLKTHCKTADAATPRCEAERAREIALSLTHCKTADSATPRCLAEREREFAAARNAEINASIAAVARARELAQARTHCKTADSTTPRCEAERAREFAAARNAEINASIARVKAERERVFAAARNAEINASIAAVKAERERAFAAARNAEINASIAMVEFVRQRNAEISASLAAVKAAREREFAAARNGEINASIAAVKAERERAFAAARNAEINAALTAYYAERALRLSMTKRHNDAGLETGAIPLPAPAQEERHSALRRTLYTDPCREARAPIGPLQFARVSSAISDAMKPELDRIAATAKACPEVSIEIHGHSDASAPAYINRNLAERRARAVLNHLVGAGVDRARLTVFSHGAREPRVDGATDIENARVEFTVEDPARHSVAMSIMRGLAQLLDPDYTPPVAGLSR